MIHEYITYLPSVKLLIALMLVFLLDFIFGVSKATINGTRRTSQGFRKTWIKFIQYGGSIIVGIVLLNIIELQSDFGKSISYYLGDFMILIMIYTEVVSIFENMEEMGGDADFIKFFVTPVKNIITFKVRNIFTKVSEKNNEK